MSDSSLSAFWSNFLGESPDWYKQIIIGFIVINPLLLMVAGPVVTGWALIAEFIFTLAFLMFYSFNSFAEEKYTANECFEKLSRGTLKFNMALDNAIFKPVAKGYRALPVPIRKGSSNFVGNLRSLLTLSNNIL